MTVGNEIATFTLYHSDVVRMFHFKWCVYTLEYLHWTPACYFNSALGIGNNICPEPTTHAAKVPSSFLGHVLFMFKHVYLSSFFLQQAVTQSRALVQTTTVNMTWKAPIRGRKNVAFWYDTEQDIGTQYACLPLCWILYIHTLSCANI